MRVVISGVAGFIGSHLADRYLSGGDAVTGLDNMLTGDAENIRNARESARFTFAAVDVADDPAIVEEAVNASGKPDLVLHFASPASPVDYANHPLETMRVNSRGTDTLAHTAQRCGARFLYASTSEAYGDPLEHPQRESYWGHVNPVGPRSCYDESKRYGEALVWTMLRDQGFDGRIIRIFNTYGPRMQLDDGRVVPNFVRQALTGEPLTIYGEGSQTRSFCYVDDLVEGIMRCAASARARGVVINLGNPAERSIRDFAQLVCAIAGVPLTTQAMPLPPDDPARRCPDISRARELLDWEPRVDLDEGLRRTIDYFKTMMVRA